jgi:SAM-dependent methyltransferase
MGFLDSVISKEMRDRFNEVLDTRPDGRIVSYILTPDKIAEWLHSVGPGYDDTLRFMLPAIPPLSLRSIVAAPEEEIFLWTGANDISYFLSLLEHYASPDLVVPRRILDFGCGCGRLTRYLGLSERYRTTGTDINQDHVDWCAANLPRVTTLRNEVVPPLPLADNSIDFAFSLSVFSHLPERAALAWLSDLARVLAPGGLLIITTHGLNALQVIRPSKIHHAMFGMDEAAVDVMSERLGSERLVFVPYSAEVVDAAKAGDEYGNTFISMDKAESLWGDLFETVYSKSGGLRGWQDVFVLRRRHPQGST